LALSWPFLAIVPPLAPFVHNSLAFFELCFDYSVIR
jgi:hypothetical protein